MQRSSSRRVTRRSQPRPHPAATLKHTSTSAGSESQFGLSYQYLEALDSDINQAQLEQDVWANDVRLKADGARAEQAEIRRHARLEAVQQLERRRLEQQQIYDERRAERNARAAIWEEQERQRLEQIQRVQEEAERRRREEQEAQRRAEEAERERRERLRTCTVCMEDMDISLMTQTLCEHWYCQGCLRGAFEAALDSRTIFHCCQRSVPLTLVSAVVTHEFTNRYELLVLEGTTPNPTYCAASGCGAFIPPVNYHGPDSAQCQQCLQDTCRHCRTAAHTGRGCIADQATEQVRALATVLGWKPCPRCANMVERRDGCLHMSCRCGAEFCYRCGGYWQDCRSRCEGRYF